MPVYKTNLTDTVGQPDSDVIISWSDSFSTGIELIDNQHKRLVELTNQLYQACRLGGEALDTAFKDTMSRVVEYVRLHFTTEQEMLKRINYPNYTEHKGEHDSLIKMVLETTKDYGDRKKFVPNNFVRFLKDWIVGHIAHSDKLYAAYIANQKKNGLLSDKDIAG